MSWIGKLLGGSIGFVLGGPLGAVAGAALGHGFDLVSDLEEVPPGSRESYKAIPSGAHIANDVERTQALFFLATFSLLAKVAKADGVVTPEEIKVVEGFMANNLGLDARARHLAIRIFNEAKRSPHGHEAFAEQLYQLLHSRPDMLVGLLEILYRLAMADGVLHPEEDRILTSVARSFNLGQAGSDRVRAIYVQDNDRYYAVLGVSRGDSMQTIKARHRQLTAEYHPDKIIAKGLPEEFVKFATAKLQEINEAYDAIRKQRSA